MLSVRQVTKKNQNQKVITGVKWKKNQKQKQTGCSVKSRNGQHEEQCWSWEQCSQEKLSCSGVISSHFALLSF